MRIIYRDGWSETFWGESKIYVTPEGVAVIGNQYVSRVFSSIAEVMVFPQQDSAPVEKAQQVTAA